MAGNGRRCRSRWDNAADVAQTVRAGAAQEPHEPPHQRAAHRLLKLDVEQLKEAVAAPPSSNAVRSPMGANRALVAKCAPDGFRESLARSARIGPRVSRANPEPVFGPRGRLRGSDSTLGRYFDATLFPSSKRGSPTVGPPGFQLQVVPSTLKPLGLAPSFSHPT